MNRKFSFLALILAFCMGLSVRGYAADLIVEENGVLPNYATIQSAVTAAVSGDRIFIKNKAGNVPYNENVTITAKSLSLLSYDPDGLFYVFGSYTINITAGQEVNIIGMHNSSGGVAAFAASTLSNPTRVNILGSTFLSGNINFDFLGYVTHLAGNNINGNITVRTSTVTGNQIDGALTINSPTGAVTGYPEDTLYVVGNRFCTAAGGYGSGGINWNNNQDYLMIANNWVRYGATGITLSSVKAGSGVNNLENNSIEKNASGVVHGISVGALGANTNLMIRNNALYDEQTSSSWTDYAVAFGTITGPSFVNLDYNVFRNWIGGLTNASTTSVSQTGNSGSTTMNPADVTGICSAAECINLGSPSTDYTDLDLSRNDVGVAGGSYNYNNFWPNNTGGARVYLVKTPRTVVQSSTINAKADSYDR
jgi:hypothetical protein